MRWKFTPGLWPTLVTLALFPALISLGFWQVDRAIQKEALRAQFIQRSAAGAVDLNQSPDKTRGNSDYMRWRQSIAHGSFDSREIILLDNQVMHGRAGYFVYAPFHLADQDISVLVNYGWVPVGSDRATPPAVVLPEQKLTIKGMTRDVPATGIKLGPTGKEILQKRFMRVQEIDLQDLANDRNILLLPYVLRTLPPAPDGFVRDWSEPGFGKEKHQGYAFQWFALATALLIIYLVVNLKKIEQ